jgi:putative AdoMet-dependent methyltransferase
MKYNCYDDLAKKYDDLVEADIENFRFPYSEHSLVHDLIAEYISEKPKNEKIKVLDIGIGTGSLYEKIIPETIDLTGIDNCEAMLEIAKLRCPEAKLINHNLKKGLPQEIKEEKYDFIVVTYFLMHFDFEFILYFIELFRKHLAPFGKLFIGDIMFYNQDNLNKFLQTNTKSNDKNINFHVYEEILERIDDSFELSYMEVNNYTGLIIVEKLFENSLQYEDTLVKYKSNTMKWKSSHPEKKSE